MDKTILDIIQETFGVGFKLDNCIDCLCPLLDDEHNKQRCNVCETSVTKEKRT